MMMFGGQTTKSKALETQVSLILMTMSFFFQQKWRKLQKQAQGHCAVLY